MFIFIINTILIIFNTYMYSWLSEMQTIVFESWFSDVLNIFVNIFLMSNFFLCFYVGWAGSLYFMNVIFTGGNIFAFVVFFYFCYLNSMAYESVILTIPSIGLSIIKIKWTKGQLERFFEIFEKEFENFKEEFENEMLFSDDEKENLIEMSINPTDLKENMLLEILEALKESGSAPIVQECLSYIFYCFIYSLGIYTAVPVELVLFYSSEILVDMAVQAILQGDSLFIAYIFVLEMYGIDSLVKVIFLGG